MSFWPFENTQNIHINLNGGQLFFLEELTTSQLTNKPNTILNVGYVVCMSREFWQVSSLYFIFHTNVEPAGHVAFWMPTPFIYIGTLYNSVIRKENIRLLQNKWGFNEMLSFIPISFEVVGRVSQLDLE